jgi:hypothetical protein
MNHDYKALASALTELLTLQRRLAITFTQEEP